MTKKQIIKARVPGGHIDLYKLEGPIDSAIDHLVHLKQKYPDKQLELSVEVNAYDEESSIYLYERREETDGEYETRMAETKAVEEWQRRVYEDLKKKFGDS